MSEPMNQTLDEQTVRQVAHLARLKITDDEVARYAAQLSRVLAYVEQLNELDTRDVPPTAHPLPLHNVFREDAPREGWSVETALANAPGHHESFFQVPRVLDQETA